MNYMSYTYNKLKWILELLLTKLAVSVKPSTAAQRGPHSNTENIFTVRSSGFSTKNPKAYWLQRRKKEQESYYENEQDRDTLKSK